MSWLPRAVYKIRFSARSSELCALVAKFRSYSALRVFGLLASVPSYRENQGLFALILVTEVRC